MSAVTAGSATTATDLDDGLRFRLGGRRAFTVWLTAIAIYVLAVFHRTSLGVAGIIAADPRIFPMSRHVELFSAGRYLGRFRVEDTGGAVHGAHIDIWTPDCSDAERFGTRPGVASLVALGD